MLKAARASLLVLLLACSAQAGHVPNDTPAPPPDPDPVVEAVAETTDPAYESSTYDVTTGLTQAALDLLLTMPSLL